MTDGINGKLGRIEECLEHIELDVAEIKREAARRDDVEALRGEFRMVREDHEARLRQLEGCVARTDERQKVIVGGLAALQVAVGAVATWLGMQK